MQKRLIGLFLFSILFLSLGSAFSFSDLFNFNKGITGKVVYDGSNSLYNGLVSYWSFEEDSGTVAYDSKGSNNGNYNGASVTSISCLSGKCASFAGSGNILVPNSNSFNFGQTTLSLWVRPTEAGLDNDGILYKGTYSNAQPEYGIILGLGNKAIFRLNEGSSDSYSSALSSNQWYHIVGTFNGTIHSIYVNGVLAESKYYNGGMNVGSGNIYIGSYYNSGYSFSGLIDDVMIFNRALSANEVSQIYQNQPLTVSGGTSGGSTGTTTCSSFTYSNWGPCINGQQTRTVLSSSPAGCTGGSPSLTQSCNLYYSYVNISLKVNSTNSNNPPTGYYLISAVNNSNWDIRNKCPSVSIGFNCTSVTPGYYTFTIGAYGYNNVSTSVSLPSSSPYNWNYTTLTPLVSNVICTDNEIGLNYSIAGTVSLNTTNIGTPFNISTDFCFNSNTLVEYYCSSPSTLGVQNYNCPFGCSNGSCLANNSVIQCMDSDGGLNYNVKGVLSVGGQDYEDKCMDSNFVTEYLCDNPPSYYDNYYCPNGCFDGACSNSTSPPEPDCDNGCYYKDKCIPYGTRVLLENNQPGYEVTRIENDGVESIYLNTEVTDGEISFNLLYSNQSGIAGFGKDDNRRLITSYKSNLNFDTDTDEWFIVSWYNGYDSESYVLTVSDIDGSDSSKNTTTIKSVAFGSTLARDLDIGESEDFGKIRLYLNKSDDAQNTAQLIILANTGNGAVRFNKLFTRAGLTIELPYFDSVRDIRSYQLNFIEENGNGEIANGHRFNATIGFNIDNELEVSNVSSSNELSTLIKLSTLSDQNILSMAYPNGQIISTNYPYYCSIEGNLQIQKTIDVNGDWATCQNNYECESNVCSSGQCVEVNDLLQQGNFLKSFFIRSVCTLINPFNEEERAQCIVDYLS